MYLSIYLYIYISLMVRGWNYLVTKVSFACIVASFIFVLQYWGIQLKTSFAAGQFSNLDIGAAEAGSAGVLRMGIRGWVSSFPTPITPSLSLKIARASEDPCVAPYWVSESKGQMDGLVPRGFNLAALILIGSEASRDEAKRGALLQSTQRPKQTFKDD